VSLPRQVVPGRVYLVTRRCTQRTFLLHPDQPTCEAVVYCLGLAAERAEIDVVAFVAMSNHWHGVVVDRAGRLPEFLECFHKLLAKHQNALRGRWENFWASEQTSAVELVDPADILDKVIYTLTNPVVGHLVSRAHHWPGASSLQEMLHDRPLEAPRPVRFFRANGPCPPTVSFRMRRPPGLEHLTHQQFATLLREKVAEREAAAAAERAATGRRVLGRAGVLRQSWRDQPDTREHRRQLDPRVACKNLWRRIETLRRNKLFVEAYRVMRELWRAGEQVVFPYGTYWLRRFTGALCTVAEQDETNGALASRV
jgi:putative transposase